LVADRLKLKVYAKNSRSSSLNECESLVFFRYGEPIQVLDITDTVIAKEADQHIYLYLVNVRSASGKSSVRNILLVSTLEFGEFDTEMVSIPGGWGIYPTEWIQDTTVSVADMGCFFNIPLYCAINEGNALCSRCYYKLDEL